MMVDDDVGGIVPLVVLLLLLHIICIFVTFANVGSFVLPISMIYLVRSLSVSNASSKLNISSAVSNEVAVPSFSFFRINDDDEANIKYTCIVDLDTN
jgi:fucose 4-O-acetylase-like acetyltransferase